MSRRACTKQRGRIVCRSGLIAWTSNERAAMRRVQVPNPRVRVTHITPLGSIGALGCDARYMPSHLVKSYLADSPSAVDDARERAQRAARAEVGVRYLRTTFLPGGETILHLFEAPRRQPPARPAARGTRSLA